VRTQLPYEFYALPFCRPAAVARKAENLGEVLRGDRIESSAYEFKFGVDERCKVLCAPVTLDEGGAKKFKEAIENEYRAYIVLDNLPVAVPSPKETDDGVITTLERGVPVGQWAPAAGGAGKKGAARIYNHLTFTVRHHPDPDTGLSRIVGFEVVPASVEHKVGKGGAGRVAASTCDPAAEGDASPIPAHVDAADAKPGETITFTYDVLWRESPLAWGVRWGPLLGALGNGGAGQGPERVHWFAAANAASVAALLAGMVALILARTLRNDIAAYNALDGGGGGGGAAGDGDDETGWKLVHGDVFRPPPRPALLAAVVGTGAQLGATAACTLAAAAAGFLSPANRGGFATAAASVFVAAALVGGYVSARVYKLCRGEAWKRATLATACGFPALVSAVGLALNAVAAAQESSRAAPFSTLVALLAMWLGVALPLTFVGAAAGYKAAPAPLPVRVNKIPRQVPPQPWYLAPLPAAALGGVLPFGAIFIELFFVLGSVWRDQLYHLFGFLALAAIVLVVTCAEISVVLVYFSLAGEDYRWWWRSVAAPAASGAYLLAYAAHYFVTRLDTAGAAAAALYFGYNALVAAAFAAFTGAAGFAASLAFVKAIYGAVKID
jgi:transmembrane 9 superfamily protein 2/4